MAASSWQTLICPDREWNHPWAGSLNESHNMVEHMVWNIYAISQYIHSYLFIILTFRRAKLIYVLIRIHQYVSRLMHKRIMVGVLSGPKRSTEREKQNRATLNTIISSAQFFHRSEGPNLVEDDHHNTTGGIFKTISGATQRIYICVKHTEMTYFQSTSDTSIYIHTKSPWFYSHIWRTCRDNINSIHSYKLNM